MASLHNKQQNEYFRFAEIPIVSAEGIRRKLKLFVEEKKVVCIDSVLINLILNF